MVSSVAPGSVPQTRRRTGAGRVHELADQGSVVATDGESGQVGPGRVGLILHVAGQHVRVEHRRGAAVGGPWDCAGGRGAKHAVGEHRLAADIAAGEVRLGTEPHVDRL